MPIQIRDIQTREPQFIELNSLNDLHEATGKPVKIVSFFGQILSTQYLGKKDGMFYFARQRSKDSIDLISSSKIEFPDGYDMPFINSSNPNDIKVITPENDRARYDALHNGLKEVGLA